MTKSISITCKTGELIEIAKLERFQGDLKEITPEAMDKLKSSIIKYGFSFPIFVWKTKILDGHQRLEAAKQLIKDGYMLKSGKLPVVQIEADSDQEAAEKLLLINSRYAQMTQAGFDAFVTDFDIDLSDFSGLLEIQEIDFDFDGGGDFYGNTDPDEVPDVQPDIVSKRGDIWIMGDHRLMCGDSTLIDDVEALMAGIKAVLMQTDPPYGVSHVATKDGIPRSGFSDMSKRWEHINNDDLEDEKLQNFLELVFINADKIALKDNCAWYLWHAHLSQGFFAAAAAAAAANILLHRQIIWVKPSFVLTRSGMYHWRHEPCFYGWKKGHKPPWYGNKSQDTVWQIGRDQGNIHPTQKPVDLWKNGIENHTKENDVIFEPFCGSGSQIIAAQKTNRRCFAIEISERYCDVAVRRWQDFTGQQAVLESTGEKFDDIPERHPDNDKS